MSTSHDTTTSDAAVSLPIDTGGSQHDTEYDASFISGAIPSDSAGSASIGHHDDAPKCTISTPLTDTLCVRVYKTSNTPAKDNFTGARDNGQSVQTSGSVQAEKPVYFNVAAPQQPTVSVSEATQDSSRSRVQEDKDNTQQIQ